MANTQIEFVKKALKNKGFITRNECLREYISRLGAIILVLKHEGYHFRTERVKGDYKYVLMLSPEEDKILRYKKLEEEAEQRDLSYAENY
jgi:hypothetical protein